MLRAAGHIYSRQQACAAAEQHLAQCICSWLRVCSAAAVAATAAARTHRLQEAQHSPDAHDQLAVQRLDPGVVLAAVARLQP
jgi:hypothetical protein